MGQMMRRSPAEKREIIDLVEHSALPVGRTLAELDVPRSSFYRWYQQYQQEGEKGLDPQAFEAPAVLEPVAGGGVRPDPPASAGSAGKVSQAAGPAVHGPGRLFCLGIKRIPAPEALRSGRDSCLSAGHRRRSVCPLARAPRAGSPPGG